MPQIARLEPAYLPEATIARAIAVSLGPSAVLDCLVLGCIGVPLRSWLCRFWRPSRWLLRVAMLGASFPLIYLLLIRPWHRRWGATEQEMRLPLPGDVQEEAPGFRITRAITIRAPIEIVWGWLAQIGQNRGGFYSYDWLENLAGCQIKSANRVHPEWQHPRVGDTLAVVQGWGPPLIEVDPGRSLVIDGWGGYSLTPVDSSTTRLLARATQPRGPGVLMYALLVEIPHFIMERKMLLGLRDRAEQSARARS